MQLPPDDTGPLPLEDGLPELPEDVTLSDNDWLVEQLSQIMENEGASKIIAPCAGLKLGLPSDICEEVDAPIMLPGNPSRATCACKQQCIPRLMKKAEASLIELKDQIVNKLSQEPHPCPPESDITKGQIVRGENHKGFPFISLDMPQTFSKTQMSWMCEHYECYKW